MTGWTYSSNFPTANALQAVFSEEGCRVARCPDVFISKLNAAGSALVYSTYLGGGGLDVGHDIAVDGDGNAYVAGRTDSANFPTANPLQEEIGGGPDTDAFVAKLNSDGSALMYSTYLGGSDSDGAFGIAVDGTGQVYVTGNTESENFPTANAVQAAGNAIGPAAPDAFVTHLNAAGSALVYSTYLGGSEYDAGRSIAVDTMGSVYVGGMTESETSFPLVNPTQSADPGAFVTKFGLGGSALAFSTFLGGSDSDAGDAIAVDTQRRVYLTGHTQSLNFPTVNALQSACGSTLPCHDAYIAKLNTEDVPTMVGLSHFVAARQSIILPLAVASLLFISVAGLVAVTHRA